MAPSPMQMGGIICRFFDTKLSHLKARARLFEMRLAKQAERKREELRLPFIAVV